MTRITLIVLLSAVLLIVVSRASLAATDTDGRPQGLPTPLAPPEETVQNQSSAEDDWDNDGPFPRVLHAGNVTIDGSACIGNDCNTDPPSPSYGFDTLRFMENNIRVLAMDSSVGSFATRDWQIEFNSSLSGGPSYFMVRDCGNTASTGSTCNGTPQLTIEADADNDSIYVDSSGNQGGNVGFGTTSPAVDLDVLSGNTPTLRLQQDNSSGFGPQTWDVAGNEANFFIRDVTGGSSLPIRIEPGVASNTLYLDSAERIGVSTSNPATKLHIRATASETLGAGNSMLLLERLGGALAFQLKDGDTDEFWNFSMTNNAASFRASRSGTGAVEFEVKENGLVTYRVFASAPTSTPAQGDVYLDTSGAFCVAFTAGTWTNISNGGSCI